MRLRVQSNITKNIPNRQAKQLKPEVKVIDSLKTINYDIYIYVHQTNFNSISFIMIGYLNSSLL